MQNSLNLSFFKNDLYNIGKELIIFLFTTYVLTYKCQKLDDDLSSWSHEETHQHPHPTLLPIKQKLL